MKHDRDFSQTQPVACPFCTQPVAFPAFDVIRETLGLQDQLAHALEAIWFGHKWDAQQWPNRKPCNLPVVRETIYASMYRNDENGGPSYTMMGRQLKWVVFHLKNRLVGSGVGVESAGYGKGYRLIIASADRNAA